MTDIQIGIGGLVALVILLAMKMPIGIALIGASFGGLWLLADFRIAWSAVGIVPYQFAANWTLSSVPMFLLMGYVCYHGQMTQGLFRAARMWLSSLPGGLAVAAIFASSGFAAVSGSSVANSAAMGRIAIPEMLKARYHPELATGSVAAAGTIGALIPPSIILILYGMFAQVSVTQLFIGGAVAGALTALAYVAVVIVRVKLNPELAPNDSSRFTRRERWDALFETWPILIIFMGIFGGLFSGLFTPTEAGAVGALLACGVGILRRSLSWTLFRQALVETMITTSALIIIGIGASLLTRFLALSGAGAVISDTILSFGSEPLLVIFGIVLIYLVLGMFLEPLGAMLLTLPVILPVIHQLDLSLIWFGVILTKLLEMGMITPPIGMNVFVVKNVMGDQVSMGAIFKGVFWFLVVDMMILGLLILYPELIISFAG